MEEMNGSNICSRPMIERRARPLKEQALNCPRCNSTNTKFCYYNNYSLTQPRYFCKTCRRYWTEGGSLRNVPVGGGSRKNKRSSTSTSPSPSPLPSSASTNSSKKISDLITTQPNCSKINYEGQDLNLNFQTTQDYHTISEFVELPNIDNRNNNNNPSSSTTTSSLSALELLRSSGITSRGLSLTSFMPMPIPIPDATTVYPSGFPLQDLKPTLDFGVDGLGGSAYGIQGSGGRLLFPFEDLRQVSSTPDFEQNRGHGDSNGYWSGLLGGGGGGGSW